MRTWRAVDCSRWRLPTHPNRLFEIYDQSHSKTTSHTETRSFAEKVDFFTCSEIFVWFTRTQRTRSCSGSVARDFESGRSPHAAPPSPAKIHRFREKADSKKNISRSNSPTANYSGLVFSFFGVSFSVHLAIYLMFAFRSIETSTPASTAVELKKSIESSKRRLPMVLASLKVSFHSCVSADHGC